MCAAPETLRLPRDPACFANALGLVRSGHVVPGSGHARGRVRDGKTVGVAAVEVPGRVSPVANLVHGRTIGHRTVCARYLQSASRLLFPSSSFRHEIPSSICPFPGARSAGA